MQHVSMYGLPTPPPSPAFGQKCPLPQHISTRQHYQPRFIPATPAERLGRTLTGSIQLTGIIGTGAYGVVYSALDTVTKARYAVKCLSRFNADGTPVDRRQVAYQEREIRLHIAASAHPNVVSVNRIIEMPDCLYVILEYCPEGDLFYNITERGQYVGKDHLAKRAFLQLLDAVEFCHSQGIYHRDLKPENILVKDNGETVKLADFGLAIASDRSEDYGCGSTFYMSPECLDPSTRRPFYLSAPNDVWSLGVILVNLTCGRNPWKQASYDDHTFRAFCQSPGFLKTILPITDELNDILERIFVRNPDERITLPELKARIIACSRFTVSSSPEPLITPPASPERTPDYVNEEESAVEDDYDYDTPLSPALSDGESDDGSSCSDGFSDDESTCSSDEGSLISSCTTVDDEDDDRDDDCFDLPEVHTPPPHPEGPTTIHIADDERMAMAGYQEIVHQTMEPLPEPKGQMAWMCPPVCQEIPRPAMQEPMPPMPMAMPTMHMPVPQSCAPKSYMASWAERFRLAPSSPPIQHPFHYYQPVQMFHPIYGF